MAVQGRNSFRVGEWFAKAAPFERRWTANGCAWAGWGLAPRLVRPGNLASQPRNPFSAPDGPGTPPGASGWPDRVDPRGDRSPCRRRLQALLPQDVVAADQERIRRSREDYWRSSTAIGFIFTLGAGHGLCGRLVIVYQILYSDVSDPPAGVRPGMAMGIALRSCLWWCPGRPCCGDVLRLPALMAVGQGSSPCAQCPPIFATGPRHWNTTRDPVVGFQPDFSG